VKLDANSLVAVAMDFLALLHLHKFLRRRAGYELCLQQDEGKGRPQMQLTERFRLLISSLLVGQDAAEQTST